MCHVIRLAGFGKINKIEPVESYVCIKDSYNTIEWNWLSLKRGTGNRGIGEWERGTGNGERGIFKTGNL